VLELTDPLAGQTDVLSHLGYRQRLAVVAESEPEPHDQPLTLVEHRQHVVDLRRQQPIGDRLDFLSCSTVLNEVAELGAVAGREFDLDVPASILGLDDAARMAVVAELVDRSVLEDAEGGRLRFVHDKLREAAYAAVDPARRALHHRDVARAIERRHGPDGLAPHAAALAAHWEQAGDVAAAVTWLERAAEHALRVAAHAEACTHVERAVHLAAASADRARRGRWLRMLADARFGLGDVAASSRAASDALAALGAPSPSGAAGWTARLVAELARLVLNLDSISKLDRAIAQPLYLGNATDTGWFRHSNVTGDLLRVAASLVEAGAEPSTLYQLTEQQDRPQRLKLLACALHSMELSADSQLGIMTLTRADFSATGAEPSESGGFVDFPALVPTVLVVALLTETTDQHGAHQVKISFRSKSGPRAVDVNKVAQKFGGGGHFAAAGGRTTLSLAEAKAAVIKELTATLTGT
jgi:hypothetical protein